MADIFQDYWSKLLKIVETHGWAVQTVLSDGLKPSYSYTVGLSKRGLPEMLIVGVDQKFAQTILNNAVAKLVDGKITGRKGELVSELANMPLAPRLSSDGVIEEFALGARRYARETGHSMSLIQLVLPDRTGLFPWDAECEKGHLITQALTSDPWQDYRPNASDPMRAGGMKPS